LRLPLAIGAAVSCLCWGLTLHHRKAIVASLEDAEPVPAIAAPVERGA
jgi:hypothetical protein